jgi:hypothetical protein
MGNLALSTEAAGAEPAFERYAVYFTPRPGTALASLGRCWLGVDLEDGFKSSAPSDFVASPRRYGFHATLKAPMRLACGTTREQFLDAVSSLAQLLHPVELGTLSIRKLGSFLALMPKRENHAFVANLAWSCVRSLDHLRAPLTPEDIARRPGLNDAEMQNLLQWGYPYVSDQFRFHMPLTSKLPGPELAAAQELFLEAAGEALDEPVCIDSICVAGDPGAPETFRLIERFDLTG